MDTLADITTKGWILALFIRSDGERLLLGDGWFDFKDGLQHFQPDTFANDVVELQGTDGQLLAGQVRRSNAQPFDGYIGDASADQPTIEQRRRQFLQFFRKRMFYTVVYIFPNGTAIQRKRGYIVDAPTVPELWQKFPEYHVALNFEDIDYYEYAEDEDGNEIFAHVVSLSIASIAEGGLIWDGYGAVSEGFSWGDPQNISTVKGLFAITDAADQSPIYTTKFNGNTEQTGTPTPSTPIPVETVTGEQVVTIMGKNLIEYEIPWGSIGADGGIGTNASFKMVVAQVKQGQTYYMSMTGGNRVYGFFTTAPKVTSYSYDGQRAVTTVQYVTAPISGWLALRVDATDTTAQIEVGSTPTTYEAPQIRKYPVNLGKNLLQGADNSSHGVDTTYDATTGVFSISGTPDAGTVQLSINIYQNIASGTYTLSTTSASSFGKRIRAFHADSTYDEITISANATSATGTFTADIVRYNILGTGMTTNVQMNDSFGLQLERGSTASSFAPYFTPIELCKIGTYQDYIWNDEGTWKVHKETGKVSLSGSETWTATQMTNSWLYYTIVSDFRTTPTSQLPNIQSDYFTQSTANAQWTSALGSASVATNDGASPNTQLRIAVGDSSNQLATFKTWLGNNKPSFYHPLATPTDTAITEQALISQLNSLNSANARGAQNNIILTPSSGAQGELDMTYYRELQGGGGFEWSAGDGGGPVTIDVAGISSAFPVWTITGPATDPTLTNVTTGQSITWNGTVPSGQTLIIDMGNQTATMAGANVFQYLSGDWVELREGANVVSYNANDTTDPSKLEWNGVVG